MNITLEGFANEIRAKNSELSAEQVKRAAQFAVILHRENEKQNLTRILGASGFYDGHLNDVVELFQCDILGEVVVDIGSGSGVPGLLAAAIDLDPERRYVLIESEINKANFLEAAFLELALKNVTVLHSRVEEVIMQMKVDTVIARAVGTVEKISGWIWKCSTWNNLVLFKSKGWEEEWKTSQLSRFGRKLTVTLQHDYSTAEKTRLLVSLERIKK